MSEIIKVVGAIIIKDGKVFAAQRNHGNYNDKWEFPGGKVEPGETDEEAVIREIKEELEGDIQVLCKVGEAKSDNRKICLACYLCKLMPGSELRLFEHKDSKWLSKEEIHSLDWADADKKIVEKAQSFFESLLN